jgi:hypothetical protein
MLRKSTPTGRDPMGGCRFSLGFRLDFPWIFLGFPLDLPWICLGQQARKVSARRSRSNKRRSCPDNKGEVRRRNHHARGRARFAVKLSPSTSARRTRRNADIGAHQAEKNRRAFVGTPVRTQKQPKATMTPIRKRPPSARGCASCAGRTVPGSPPPRPSPAGTASRSGTPVRAARRSGSARDRR